MEDKKGFKNWIKENWWELLAGGAMIAGLGMLVGSTIHDSHVRTNAVINSCNADHDSYAKFVEATAKSYDNMCKEIGANAVVKIVTENPISSATGLVDKAADIVKASSN